MLPNGQKSSEIRKPLKDDPRPKRVTGAYTLYIAAQMAAVMKEHNLVTSEAMKKCGSLWTAMSEADKEPYLEKVTGDRERYDKEKDEFDRMGYFTMPDGKKSYESKKSPNPTKRPKRSKSEPEEAKMVMEAKKA